MYEHFQTHPHLSPHIHLSALIQIETNRMSTMATIRLHTCNVTQHTNPHQYTQYEVPVKQFPVPEIRFQFPAPIKTFSYAPPPTLHHAAPVAAVHQYPIPSYRKQFFVQKRVDVQVPYQVIE